MKQQLFMLLTFVMATMTSTTFISCGEDIEDGKQEGNKETERLTVTYEELEGTWVYSAEDYGNIDYISFSSTGKGQMANASDQFTNVGEHRHTDNGAFELVYFTYTIEGNMINVYPESISGLSSFTIEVLDPISSVLNLRMDLDIVRRKRAYRKYDNDWQWFTKSGPASVDLTKDLVGTYAVDNNKSHKLEVKRVNNYTLTIYDFWLNSECTGCLYWHDQYNATDNKIYLNNPNSSITTNSYYFVNGKLYSMSGTHYFSGAASKILNDNSDTSSISSSDFIGIWRYADTVFNFKQNGTCDIYPLTSTSSYTYSKSHSGSWSYDSSSKKLIVTSTTFFFRSSDEWIIKAIASGEILTNRLTFYSQSSLPKKVE